MGELFSERKGGGESMFRCLAFEHRALQYEKYRSNAVCLKCGVEGHKAKDCKNARFCVTCREEGNKLGSSPEILITETVVKFRESYRAVHQFIKKLEAKKVNEIITQGLGVK